MNGVGCEAKQEKIIQIADEYRILIRLSSPSDEELERIDEILELAIFDVELSNSLNQIDEALAIEISLVENNNLDISVSSDINSDEIQAQDNQNKVISLLHIQDIETAISSQYPKHTNNLIYFPNSRLLHLNHHESKQFHQKTENIQNLRAIVCSFIAGGVFTLAMVPSLCIWLHKYLNPSSLPSQLFTSLNVSNKSITSPICALKFTKSNRHIQSDKIQLFSCN